MESAGHLHQAVPKTPNTASLLQNSSPALLFLYFYLREWGCHPLTYPIGSLVVIYLPSNLSALLKDPKVLEIPCCEHAIGLFHLNPQPVLMLCFPDPSSDLLTAPLHWVLPPLNYSPKFCHLYETILITLLLPLKPFNGSPLSAGWSGVYNPPQPDLSNLMSPTPYPEPSVPVRWARWRSQHPSLPPISLCLFGLLLLAGLSLHLSALSKTYSLSGPTSSRKPFLTPHPKRRRGRPTLNPRSDVSQSIYHVTALAY